MRGDDLESGDFKNWDQLCVFVFVFVFVFVIGKER
jgi:hypothetical protein